jgi:2,4-dienoyl-CoA reductase-like NADH-dependent reductase (Old Yellow Enzyme family)
MGEYQSLFSPITVRGHTYRNRIITGPTMYAAAAFMEGFGDSVYRMVERRAQGGAGAVTVGEVPVNNEEGDCVLSVPLDFSKHEGT